MDAVLHARADLASLPLPRQLLLGVAQLRRAPDRARGRSAIVDVPATTVDGSMVRAVKLKGVGVCGVGDRLAPPSARSYFEGAKRWLHVDYDSAGRLLARPADDRPTGTLLLSRARNEDAMLARVRAAGLPAPVPLGYGELCSLSFRGRRTGFVIIGLSDPADRRVGEDATAVAEQEAGPSDAPGASSDGRPDPVEWLAYWAGRVAAVERRLHAAGLAGAGPHLGNFSASGDEVVIHDLDALRELPDPEAASTQVLGHRLRDYYVLAASVGRRAYVPHLRARRAEVMRAVGEGYFGPRPELGALRPFDHLSFWSVLRRRGRLDELPAPLLGLMRSAIHEDHEAGARDATRTAGPQPRKVRQ